MQSRNWTNNFLKGLFPKILRIGSMADMQVGRGFVACQVSWVGGLVLARLSCDVRIETDCEAGLSTCCWFFSQTNRVVYEFARLEIGKKMHWLSEKSWLPALDSMKVETDQLAASVSLFWYSLPFWLPSLNDETNHMITCRGIFQDNTRLCVEFQTARDGSTSWKKF